MEVRESLAVGTPHDSALDGSAQIRRAVEPLDRERFTGRFGDCALAGFAIDIDTAAINNVKAKLRSPAACMRKTSLTKFAILACAADGSHHNATNHFRKEGNDCESLAGLLETDGGSCRFGWHRFSARQDERARRHRERKHDHEALKRKSFWAESLAGTETAAIDFKSHQVSSNQRRKKSAEQKRRNERGKTQSDSA